RFTTRNATPRDAHDFLDQLVVREAGDARRLREARVHERIRNDSGQWIELHHVGYTEAVHPDVDPAPVTAAERAVGVERDALRFADQRLRNPARRALENLERVIARIPDPLRFVAVNGRRAGRQRRKIESDDRQTAHVAVVAQDRNGEFGTGQIGLDQDGLVVTL